MHADLDMTPLKKDIFLENRRVFSYAAIAVLSLAILTRLPYEFHRLLVSDSELGAIDLIQRYEEIRAWFSGNPVYGFLDSAVYPPASYLIMWPFMGYESWTVTRWIWAISSIALLIFLIQRLLSAQSISTPLNKLFWSLFICAHYATGITIGNGQLTIHIMAVLMAALAFLTSRQQSWPTYLWVGLFAALSLIKPTVTLPFMWLVLFIPRTIYPALFTGVIYGLMAIVASTFQEGGLFQLHLTWFSQGVSGAVWSSTVSSDEGVSDLLGSNILGQGVSNFSNLLGGDVGYADIHSILGAFGMGQWAMPSSLTILFLTGIWMYFYRHCSVWSLMGVAAIISRIWTYHRVYDDMLIIFAIFAVIAIIRQESYSAYPSTGKVLLVLLVVASLVPSSLRLLPFPLNLGFTMGQFLVWIATLLYLLISAHLERQFLMASSQLRRSQTAF